jgi:hypothetical protein
MKKTRTEQINKEISALDKLADIDIDTSDIVELKDWSESVSGRFYCSRQRVIEARLYRADQPQNSLPGHENHSDKSEQQSDDRRTGVDPITDNGITEPNWESIPDTQLLAFCSQNKEEAWQEFRSRYQHRIAKITTRIALQRGYSSREVIDDIIEEINSNFVADAHRLSKAIPIKEEPASPYVRRMVNFIVQDHLKRYKHRKDVDKLNSISTNIEKFGLGHNGRLNLFIEIYKVLREIASEHEQGIFWLYYQGRLSSQQIADLPETKLTPKGVESLLKRLTREVESQMKENHSEYYQAIEKIPGKFFP